MYVIKLDDMFITFQQQMKAGVIGDIYQENGY